MNKLLVAAHWALMLVIAGSAIWLLGSAYQLWQQANINEFIADPGAYETMPDDARAHAFGHAVGVDERGHLAGSSGLAPGQISAARSSR